MRMNTSNPADLKKTTEEACRIECTCGSEYGVRRVEWEKRNCLWVQVTRTTWCEECGDNQDYA
jgi:hypothetical protein